jgi:hypothetical protein
MIMVEGSPGCTARGCLQERVVAVAVSEVWAESEAVVLPVLLAGQQSVEYIAVVAGTVLAD